MQAVGGDLPQAEACRKGEAAAALPMKDAAAAQLLTDDGMLYRNWVRNARLACHEQQQRRHSPWRGGSWSNAPMAGRMWVDF